MKKVKKYYKKVNRYRHKIFRGSNLYFFDFCYFAILLIVMMSFGLWVSPDRFIIFGLFLAFIIANPLNFIKDWSPFLFLLLSYEFLRGLVPHLNTKVNIFPLIDADKFMFNGHIPTIELQKWLYVPGQLHFYDFFFAILYMMHFALPLIFGYLLWVKKRERFRHFAISLLVLSYVAFATYYLYPAMPPWMASDKGYIPTVYNIFDQAASHFFKGGSLPSVYWMFSPNPVAAMPSLHAAYPTLVFLYMLKYFGRKFVWFGLYVFAVYFAIIYLGHHYVIDALIGAVYAAAVFFAMEHFFSWREKVRRAKAKQEKAAEKQAEPEPEPELTI